MSAPNLVIVESPAKGKTIEKYLGGGYRVLASFGHVRDLPARDGSVRPDEDFAMDWELGDRAKRPISEITKAAREAQHIYLATDPDREGEAISWHVQEVLRAQRGLAKADFKRVTFNEITKSAVTAAMANPRDVNPELVEAYLARRALDYLVGFSISPVLWRKLPGSRSAGRVQSVALRLICEREFEIEAFRPREYWSIAATFRTADGGEFTARLTHLDGKKLDKFALPNAEAALAAASRLQGRAFRIADVERKQVRRNPSPPFTTSTLQQEASRKLGLSATQTMRLAQRLYEGVDIGGETVGLITYMRTDGTQLAGEAIGAMRSLISDSLGSTYLPDNPRIYKSTAKNAQEAHEAIRPTDPRREPRELRGRLGAEEHRLYDLIWKRAIACQMASAILDQVAVDVGVPEGDVVLRATGSIVRFDGYLKVYEEGRDDPAEGEDADGQRRLPQVQPGDGVERTGEIDRQQHFTQPPPRYTEASLVRRLEELGIGRPSTYAQILQVLQDRDYVRLEKKRFHPEDRGRLVTAFLKSFFSRYVEYDFTAQLETQLDDVSGGRRQWKQVLREFWEAFSAAVGGASGLSMTQVIDALDEEVGPHFFPPRSDGVNPRACPACQDGRLGLKLSRSGAFIGCSNYPDCRFTRPLEVVSEESPAEAAVFPRALGDDPETGEPVSVRKGPYGHYVQAGEGENGNKPRRVSLPRRDDPMAITLDRALALLALPRELGPDPDSGQMITAGIGRYGPYLKLGNAFKSLPPDEDVLTVGMNRACELLADRKGSRGSEPLRELGVHPKDGSAIAIYKGRFGPYVRHGKVMASLPKSQDVDSLTLEAAVALVDAKAAKGKGSSRKAPAKKAAAAGKEDKPKKSAASAKSRKSPAGSKAGKKGSDTDAAPGGGSSS